MLPIPHAPTVLPASFHKVLPMCQALPSSSYYSELLPSVPLGCRKCPLMKASLWLHLLSAVVARDRCQKMEVVFATKASQQVTELHLDEVSRLTVTSPLAPFLGYLHERLWEEQSSGPLLCTAKPLASHPCFWDGGGKLMSRV